MNFDGHVLVVVRLLLAVLAVWSFSHQWQRIRHMSVAGVAPVAWFGLAFTQWTWVAYATVIGDPTLLLPALAGTMAVVVAVSWARTSDNTTAVWWLPVLALTIVSLRLGAPGLLGDVAATVDIAVILPQVWRSLRDPDVTGVSVSAWGWRAVLLLPWTVYGLLVALWPVWVSSGIKMAASVVVAVATHLRTPAGRNADVTN